MKIIIPSIEAIIEINKRLNGNIINRGALEFIIAKIESRYKDEDLKKQISKIAAILWMEIIQNHPFLDGNKRTATETAILFLEKNNFVLDTPVAGKVYISLKIANNEITYEELVIWLHERIKKVKE